MVDLAGFKKAQQQVWSGFAAVESHTGLASPQLVRFAEVIAGARVLDVGCGSGALALTAARTGAVVAGLDLTPQQIAKARENAALMGLDVDWEVGDVEDMPYDDGRFDMVLSQYGHMFAPSPELAVSEMLRVLRPGGTIAFATWPPDALTGGVLRLNAKYSPPDPVEVPPPVLWGDPDVVRERLGDGVADIVFEDGVTIIPSLSPQHYRSFMEANTGPVTRVVVLLGDDEEGLASYRGEMDDLIAQYFEDNTVRRRFLMTRAVKE
jgi:SAM-dependent methyltransferase